MAQYKIYFSTDNGPKKLVAISNSLRETETIIDNLLIDHDSIDITVDAIRDDGSVCHAFIVETNVV